jgi:hypothetical protein
MEMIQKETPTRSVDFRRTPAEARVLPNDTGNDTPPVAVLERRAADAELGMNAASAITVAKRGVARMGRFGCVWFFIFDGFLFVGDLADF